MLGIVCPLQGLWPTRFLQSKGMGWIGKISYGIYVYHLPLLILGASLSEKKGMNIHGQLRPVFFAAWVCIVILVSDQSYRWLETPFLKLKKRSGAALRTSSSMVGENRLGQEQRGAGTQPADWTRKLFDLPTNHGNSCGRRFKEHRICLIQRPERMVHSSRPPALRLRFQQQCAHKTGFL
jgi:hypothetical protein